MTDAANSPAQTVIIGNVEVARRLCASLVEQGLPVTHLPEPTDGELRAALTAEVSAVAVLVRGDVVALRYALLVEHVRPRVRLVATVFDRTVAEQLIRAVPNCTATSPADVSVASIVGACLGELAVIRDEQGRDRTVSDHRDGPVERPWRPGRGRVRTMLSALSRQLRPHDITSRVLLGGLLGLLLTLFVDWVLLSTALHEPVVRSIYDATRVIATVGPGEGRQSPIWYLVVSSFGMLATIVFTALFTAGLVDRTLSTRSIGLIGSRTLPRRDHVVVVGLGQVGLRLCMRLRELHVPVVAVERDPQAANLRLAKAARIPVLIAHAEDRAVLERLSLGRARALAAMGSDDLDNVEVSLAALAVAPEIAVVLRAGDDDVIAETRSLFRIGQVSDVSTLTAQAVSLALSDVDYRLVYVRDHHAAVYPPGAADARRPVRATARCDCPSR
ncbi:NAD-binding protein [Jatrophihabitans telluris]|uniref:NAD-binding protein n=1 Tax=Jatrophihabitans telluris TaxID=2038343 RepID=A0ABY4QUR8_9ACTN|nr:NAD-binding protein [Jatrophihabitans telluris]UQX87431.1 NAD-binding protein [Jatrophihabitans telluris]